MSQAEKATVKDGGFSGDSLPDLSRCWLRRDCLIVGLKKGDMNQDGNRASAKFIQELEVHIDKWERHLIAGGYAPRTVSTRTERGPRLLVRYLRGENFVKGEK